MSTPKIALVAPYAPVPGSKGADAVRNGGVERYVSSLARALGSLGQDVTVVASGEVPGTYPADGYKILHFPRWSIMEGTPVFNPMRFLKSLRGFDLVHSQATYPFISELSAVHAKLAGIPSVMTFHFEPTPLTPGGIAIAKAYAATAQKLLRTNDRIIFSTRSYRARTSFFSAKDDPRIRFVPMGVDTRFFSVQENVPRERRFLFVGRLVPYKDIPLLLESFAVAGRRLTGYELCIVGEGPLESALKAKAVSMALNVRFVGKLSDEELRALYRSSAATVLASHDQQEAFGMTLLESMSCGTPVVANAIPGVKEVAMLGGTPVATASAEAFADAMVNAAINPVSSEERRHMHSRVEQGYSWESVARRTAEVYEEIL